VQVTFPHPGAGGYLGRPGQRAERVGPLANRTGRGESTLIGKLATWWKNS
jgi:hypothetical protein